jgi:hypothetical protein
MGTGQCRCQQTNETATEGNQNQCKSHQRDDHKRDNFSKYEQQHSSIASDSGEDERWRKNSDEHKVTSIHEEKQMPGAPLGICF